MGKNKTKKDRSGRKEQIKLEKRMKRMERKTTEPVIEEMLEAFRKEQKLVKHINLKITNPPSPRSHFSFVSCDETNELILFGGEYFDGKRILMFSDLYIYMPKENKWMLVESPIGPDPRSGHHAVYMKTHEVPSSMWMFGGEFSSPSQSRFHHYDDLWRFHVRSRKWDCINVRGPCARSGHRLLIWRNSILLFGGFSDTGSKTVYYNDLWKFDTSTSQWTYLSLIGQIPSPRSASLLFVGSENKYIYVVGGYSKQLVSRDIEKGIVYSDITRLTFEKCVLIRSCGARPKPERGSIAGVSLGGNRVLVFGGVHDVESADGEEFKSYFYNEMFYIDLGKAKWSTYNLSLDKKTDAHVSSTACLDSSNQICENNAQLLPNNSSLLSTNLLNINIGDQNNFQSRTLCQTSTVNNGPSPRSRPGMALLGSQLYIYGGCFEVDDRKITLDDFYQLDLSHPTSWNCLYSGTQENQVWFDSDSGESDGDEYQKSLTKSSTMDVDETSSSDDDEDDSDDELEEDAPAPQIDESFEQYWTRTATFWSVLVQRGVDEDLDHQPPSTSKSCQDAVVTKLARKVARDFYKNVKG